MRPVTILHQNQNGHITIDFKDKKEKVKRNIKTQITNRMLRSAEKQNDQG